jgi:hypothetical protein
MKKRLTWLLYPLDLLRLQMKLNLMLSTFSAKKQMKCAEKREEITGKNSVE